MKTGKSIYVCSECGAQSSKWFGRCPACQAWNTLEETVVEPEPVRKSVSHDRLLNPESRAAPIDAVGLPELRRTETGIAELDRVLGGGLVKGSVVLLTGEPGIGKSTLLMQLSGRLSSADRKVLYVSGEESRGQLKLRANRLAIGGSVGYNGHRKKRVAKSRTEERHGSEIYPEYDSKRVYRDAR